MSETRERSIAELIGWECLGEAYFSLRWRTPDGAEIIADEPPTVTPDGMLDWLYARSSLVVIHAYEHHVEVNVGELVSGPTLHAALEAAVRAVAEESASRIVEVTASIRYEGERFIVEASDE